MERTEVFKREAISIALSRGLSRTYMAADRDVGGSTLGK